MIIFGIASISFFDSLHIIVLTFRSICSVLQPPRRKSKLYNNALGITTKLGESKPIRCKSIEKKAVKVQISCVQKGRKKVEKNVAAYASERLILQETFLKLKIRGL